MSKAPSSSRDRCSHVVGPIHLVRYPAGWDGEDVWDFRPARAAEEIPFVASVNRDLLSLRIT